MILTIVFAALFLLWLVSDLRKEKEDGAAGTQEQYAEAFTPTDAPTAEAKTTPTPTEAPTAEVTETPTPTEAPTAEVTETPTPAEAPTVEATATPTPTEAPTAEAEALLDPDGSYCSKEDVALYLYTYHRLPSNYITKKEAEKLGWSGGSLEPYAPGKCIGGDRFGNYEGVLPDGDYRECDIDTLGKKRGQKRIVYDLTDWDIYYTGDHYESFTQLY
ncbi:MAG: ribonuclease [Lachnospiraceae bacterium]|nr:ribonuclease [Lachnospiraceae bacterium]